MIRKDNGTFLFQSPILVDQSQGEGLACVSEAEALCTFLDIMDRAGPNIILVIFSRNCALSIFPQEGLDEDSVGVLMQKLKRANIKKKGVDGYSWWGRILKYSGSKYKM